MAESRVLNGRYTLETELGRGGMGVVYRARDLQLNRPVAVKVLPPEFSHDEQFLQRFRNEVLNAARLQHPHIVQVYDVGQDGDTHYYVMQLVEGCDLHTEIQRRTRFPLEDTVEIVNQVGKALDYAHDQGIVHRDIKPENILLDREGTARVLDFGIARSLQGTRLTGGIIGTPEYMSPEQARGEALDGRADQYALAIVAYEMLTGTTPFRSETAQPVTYVHMQATVEPPDARQFRGDLPDYVCTALAQALSKMAGYRFASCKQFAATLAGQVRATLPPLVPLGKADGGTIAGPGLDGDRGPVWPKAFAAFAILAVLAGGGALLVWPHKARPQHRITAPEPPKLPPGPVVQPPGPPRGKGEYIIPDSATRRLTGGDVLALSPQKRSLARNEIYARHGCVFRRSDLQAYFSKQAWYKPVPGLWAASFTKLSPIEKHNVAVIRYVENGGGE